MIEVPDAKRRAAVLHMVGGIENHIVLSIGSDTIRGVPDADRENTSPEGKASSVQFVRFPLSADQKKRFIAGIEPVMLGFDNPGYGHLAVMPPAMRETLSNDLNP